MTASALDFSLYTNTKTYPECFVQLCFVRYLFLER